MPATLLGSPYTAGEDRLLRHMLSRNVLLGTKDNKELECFGEPGETS